MDKETIVRVAFLDPYGNIVIGHDKERHHHCINRAKGALGDAEQGFLTSNYRFVNRDEAKTIAIAAGQTTEDEMIASYVLTSEDLW